MMNLQIFRGLVAGVNRSGNQGVTLGMLAAAAAVAGVHYPAKDYPGLISTIEQVGLAADMEPGKINEQTRWADVFHKRFEDVHIANFGASVRVVADQLNHPDYDELKTFAISDIQGAVDALVYFINEGGRHVSIDKSIAYYMQGDLWELKKKFPDLNLPLLALVSKPDNVVPMTSVSATGQTAGKKNGAGEPTQVSP